MDQRSVWQLNKKQALLQFQDLSASFLSLDPAKGLFDISLGPFPWPGNLLGVSLDIGSDSQNGVRAFVRARDLMVSYPQSDDQPFACRLNWRVRQENEEVVILDLIIYLQTNLLESFPRISLRSQVESEEVCRLEYDQTTSSLESTSSNNADLPRGDSGMVLVRPNESSWSYFELTHPEDATYWEFSIASSESKCTIQRSLRESFLEKGVIRILRVRGALLRRAKDMDLARTCLQSFAMEKPPLTT